MVGGRFNKQGNLHTRPVLGRHRTSRSWHPPTGILQVYVAALTGFGQGHFPEGLNTTPLSQGCLLKRAPTVGMEGREYIPRAGAGRSLQMPGSELRSAGVTSFNRHKVFREEKEMQMALQCIKRSLSLLIVREITVKTTLTAKQTVGRQVFFFF